MSNDTNGVPAPAPRPQLADMTYAPRELLSRGPHRFAHDANFPTPLGRPPRVLQSIKTINSGFASSLDGVLAEASFRCTLRQSQSTQPLAPPPSHHMPDKIFCQQLPVAPGTYEYKMTLEIVHTAVTMTATLAGTPSDLLTLVPKRLVEIRPAQQTGYTNQMIQPPAEMTAPGAANSARDTELLVGLDALFVEGSRRCIVRAAAASPQPMLVQQAQHHRPHQVCVEHVTDQTTRLHVRHTNVTLVVLVAATVDEIARFVPPNLLHVHEVNLELRPVPPAILDKIRQSVVRFRDLGACLDATSEGVMCAVCHGMVEPDEEVAKIACGHIFHKDCVIPWFETRSTCPLCRASLGRPAAAAAGPSAAATQSASSNQSPPPPAVPAVTRGDGDGGVLGMLGGLGLAATGTPPDVTEEQRNEEID